MLFNSFVFAGLFLPACLLLFWLAPGDRAKRAVLLLASLVFYGYWFPPYLALLVALVGIAWFCARAAAQARSNWPVWVAAVALLGTLGFFKYAGFLAQVATDLGIAGPFRGRAHQLALPLGISFIVFQALGYVIDVRRRVFAAEPRFSVVLLFKAFFPQLIAGPICRAHELIPQLKGHFNGSAGRFWGGLAMFMIGLFLKQVFADALATRVDVLFDRTGGYSRSDAWAAAIGFGMQIFADFWGYSTMAIGLAKMLGIELPVNFNLPYVASSIREFWRRWHITLSQWLRDYVYKPMGGSRRGSTRTIAALMATMVLGGLWHGANYTFLVWGALHGSVLSLEHLWGSRAGAAAPAANSRASAAVSRAAGWSYTIAVVLVGWVFFRASSVGQAVSMTAAMFGLGADAGSYRAVLPIALLSAGLFVLQIPIESLLRALRGDRVRAETSILTAFAFLLASIVLGAPEAIPFIYFQF